MFQLDLGDSQQDVEDHYMHVLRVKERSTDFTSGYNLSYTGALSADDVRAAHIRKEAVASLAIIQGQQHDRLKDRLLQNSIGAGRRRQSADDTDSDDSD